MKRNSLLVLSLAEHWTTKFEGLVILTGVRIGLVIVGGC